MRYLGEEADQFRGRNGDLSFTNVDHFSQDMCYGGQREVGSGIAEQVSKIVARGDFLYQGILSLAATME